jgi:plastocyanin
MNRHRFVHVMLLWTLIAAVAAVPVSATIHIVQISNFTFTPKNTMVTPGDTVRWVMVSGTHTTTSDPSSPKVWDSGIFPVGNNFDLVFTAGDGPGPFPYHCAVHLSMKDTIFVSPPPVCGDANGDKTVNVGDAVSLINYVFKGGAAPVPVCAGDANGDSNANVGDAVYLINFVFKGGPAPSTTCCP